jgi:hypothetical protein
MVSQLIDEVSALAREVRASEVGSVREHGFDEGRMLEYALEVQRIAGEARARDAEVRRGLLDLEAALRFTAERIEEVVREEGQLTRGVVREEGSQIRELIGSGFEALPLRIVAEAQAANPWAASDAGALAEISEGQRVLQESLQRATEALQGAGQSMSLAARPASLSIPPLVHMACARTETVGRIVEIARKRSWTAITGTVGCGKTQLAILINEALGSPGVWIRMRGLLSEAEACVRLDAVGTQLSASSDARRRGDATADGWRSVVASGAVVIDDLPQFENDGELSQRLTTIALVMQGSGGALLSTSHFPVPQGLVETLGGTVLAAVEAPPFTYSEAAELLGLFGAPEGEIRNGLARLIVAATSGSGTLTTAACRYLSERGWQVGPEEFNDLFGERSYRREIDRETVGRVLRTVENEHSRELLWRLGCVIGSFGTVEVRAVSAVPPSVGNPVETLHPLLGIWVQDEGSGGMVVSPLVGTLGRDSLEPEVAQRCNLALARATLSQGTLGPAEAFNALVYFQAGGDSEQAAIVLLRGLQALQESPTAQDTLGFLNLWVETPLPESVSLRIRLLLRGAQIAVRHQRGLDVMPLIVDVRDTLARSGPQEGSSIMGFAAAAGSIIAKYDLRSAQDVIGRALSWWGEGEDRGDYPLTLPAGLAVEDLVWFPVAEARTAEDLTGWIGMVGRLGDEQRKTVTASPLMLDAARMMADRVWMSEMDKPEGEREWPRVADELMSVAGASHDLGSKILSAATARARIIVAAEHLGDLEGADGIARKALAEIDGDTNGAFLVASTTGMQYVYAERWGEAESWLAEAVRHPIAVEYNALAVEALCNLARIAGMSANEAALPFAEQAVATARQGGEFGTMTLVSALGELALSRFMADDLPGVLASAGEAMHLLVANRLDTQQWKSRFVLLGFLCGYVTSMVETGTPPQTTEDGSLYATPERGVFLLQSDAISNRYEALLEPAVFLQLSLMAGRAGNYAASQEWARLTIESSTAPEQRLFLAEAERLSVVQELQAGRYREGLSLALHAGSVMSKISIRRNLGRGALALATDEDSLSPELLREVKVRGEEWCVIMGALPAAFELGERYVREAPDWQQCERDLTAFCENLSKSGDYPELWETLTHAVTETYSGTSTFDALTQLARASSEREESAAWAIAYLGASLQKGVFPAKAFAVHVSVASYAQHMLDISTYRRVVTPFLGAFWRRALQTMAFNFIGPRRVMEELEAALRAPIVEPHTILRAVQGGVILRLTAEANRWVEAGAPANLGMLVPESR